MKKFSETLEEYLKRAKKLGLSNRQIEENLISSGWKEKDISRAMQMLSKGERKMGKHSYVARFFSVAWFFRKALVTLLVLVFAGIVFAWMLGASLKKNIFIFNPSEKYSQILSALEQVNSNINFEGEYVDGRDKDFIWEVKGVYEKEKAILNAESSIGAIDNLIEVKHKLSKRTGSSIDIWNSFPVEVLNDHVKYPEASILQENWIKLTETPKGLDSLLLSAVKGSELESLDRIYLYKGRPVLIYKINTPGLKLGKYFGELFIAFSAITFKPLYIETEIYTPSIKTVRDHSLAQITQGNSIERDQQRLIDIRLLANELELYFNKNGGYPGGVNGKAILPREGEHFNWPVAPEKDGDCSEYYNSYFYRTIGDKSGEGREGEPVFSEYSIHFCLGGSASSFSKGPHIQTPTGIKEIVCDGSNPECFSSAGVFTETIQSPEFWSNFELDSVFKLKVPLDR